MFQLWLYPQTHQLAIFTYSMKRVALASSQGLALLGFFPCTILFSQSKINNPDPQMFLFYEKQTLRPFFMDGVQLPQAQGQNHFEEAVYFLPLSSPKLLVGTHFISTSEGQTTQIPRSDPKRGVSVLQLKWGNNPTQMQVSGYLYYTSV